MEQKELFTTVVKNDKTEKKIAGTLVNGETPSYEDFCLAWLVVPSFDKNLVFASFYYKKDALAYSKALNEGALIWRDDFAGPSNIAGR